MTKHLILLLFAISFVLTFAEQVNDKTFFIVSKDGTGDFVNIQDALNSIGKDDSNFFTIFVKNGTYNEKLFIEKSNIIICGESKDSTIIEFAELRRNWKQNHRDDYGSAVVNIRKNITDIIFKSLTIINNYGKLYDDHDHAFTIRGFDGVTRIILDDCSVISYGGDTLSLWNTDDGMYYYTNCHFEGWVDYVCPRGYCFIENSTFYSHNLTASIWHDGSKNEDHKFVIKNCRFDGVEGFPLGSFHRDAQFFLLDCTFSSNMADKNIFFTPSNPSKILQWGENRIYFLNCKVDDKEYKWLNDNFDKSKEQPMEENITAGWVFNNKWNPLSILEVVSKKLEKIH